MLGWQHSDLIYMYLDKSQHLLSINQSVKKSIHQPVFLRVISWHFTNWAGTPWLINLFTGAQHLPHEQALGEQWQEKKKPFNWQKPRADPDTTVDGHLPRSVGLRRRVIDDRLIDRMIDCGEGIMNLENLIVYWHEHRPLVRPCNFCNIC